MRIEVESVTISDPVTLMGGPQDGRVIQRDNFVVYFAELVERGGGPDIAVPVCDTHAYNSQTGEYLGLNYTLTD